MASQPKACVSPDAYLEQERAAATKSEYYSGEVFAMAGASRIHSQVSANTISALVIRLRGRPCIVYDSDMRVGLTTTEFFAYPDVSVACGKGQFHDRQHDTLLNPALIVEVLSPSTEAYDRGVKFALYRRLESLTDYVLISQDRPSLEHFRRQPGNTWLLATYEGLEATALLPSLGCDLPLGEIYDKVEWPDTADGEPPSLTVLEEQAEG